MNRQTETTDETRSSESALKPLLCASHESLRLEILNYEISSSWWAGWVGGNYAQELTSKYFAWKVSRKFTAYLKSLAFRKKHHSSRVDLLVSRDKRVKPAFNMVEIYGGKDPEWKGFHNLVLGLGGPAFDKAIAGPIDPETSSQIKEALKDAIRYRKLRAKHWNDGGIVVLEEAKNAELGCQTLTYERLDDALDADG